jgi:hypothetical protein
MMKKLIKLEMLDNGDAVIPMDQLTAMVSVELVEYYSITHNTDDSLTVYFYDANGQLIKPTAPS